MGEPAVQDEIEVIGDEGQTEPEAIVEDDEAAPTADTSPPEADEAQPPADDPAPEDTPVDQEPTAKELAGEVADLKRQLNAYHRRVEKLSKRKSIEKVPDQLSDEDAPKLDDFETMSEYEAAADKFRIDKRVNDGIRQALERNPEVEIKAERDEWGAMVKEEGPKAYADFNDVVGAPTLPITMEIIDAIREGNSETVSGADMLYYLGKNPTVTTKLSNMSSVQVAKAIARIEVNLETEKAKAPSTQHNDKTVSDAPPPITPTDSTIIVTKDPNKMPQSEYEKWRNDGGGR